VLGAVDEEQLVAVRARWAQHGRHGGAALGRRLSRGVRGEALAEERKGVHDVESAGPSVG
jgi:hypothetical protein